MEELAILQILIENPSTTARALAAELGKSERTIKNRIASLQHKGYIERQSGRRYGRWKVLIEMPTESKN